jgi:serine protease Do
MRGHAYGHLQVVWALLLAVLTCPAGADPAWSRYVLKVEVTHTDGRRETGSAVPLAGNRMVTNCHVLRNAVAIRVANPERQWLATMAHSDAYRDLCFLEVPGYRGPVAPVAEEETRVGKDVLAVGYTGGRLAINPGHVKGLHTCPCDGGRVIQTSAPFDRGASGGGLFNDQGRLVGILTFKSQAGGNFHFALPVGWLRGLALERMHTLRDETSFWERTGKNSSYFLAACALDAKKNWRQLSDLADAWTLQEANNPEAWMALGRAHIGLKSPSAAAAAFSRALNLDATHAEAWRELQNLEFELSILPLDS